MLVVRGMRCILWPSVILQSHLPHVENSKIMALNGSPQGPALCELDL